MEESVNMDLFGLLRGEEATQHNLYGYSPLSLAYLGDSVLDLLVKSYFVMHANKQTYKYHKEVTDIVKAKYQAEFVDCMLDQFTEEEQSVYKRGRNVKSHSKAKNATTGEYRKATGLEALYGFLYLKGDITRLRELTDRMIQNYLEKQES